MNNRRMECGRVKGPGGSSLINGIKATSGGNALDLDNWAARTWSGELELSRLPALLPQGRDSRCGRERLPRWRMAPVSVTTSQTPASIRCLEAMIEAGVEAGYPRTDDPQRLSAGRFWPDGIAPSRRAGPVAPVLRAVYLDQAKSRPNLTISYSRYLTDHIILTANARWASNGWKATATIPTRATANKEVLLCAGAIASPQISATLRRRQR